MADDGIFKPVLFIFVFVAITALLISMMGNVYTVSQGGVATIPDFYETTATPWSPDAGYDLTWANTTDDVALLGTIELEFLNADEDDEIWIGCIRNNTDYVPDSQVWYEEHLNFLSIADWTWWWFERQTISYQTIDFGHNQTGWIDTNRTEVSFISTDYNFTLTVTTPGPAANFSTDLWNNDFNLQLDEEIAVAGNPELSAWDLVAGIYTLSLPDCHPVLNTIIAIPFYAATALLAVIVISRLAPEWFSGGL